MPVTSSNAGPQTLHVPFKDWNTDPKEKQNYDELERWSLRLPRGLIQRDEQNHAQIQTIVPSVFTSYMQSSKPVTLEVGRQYKVSCQWPGISMPDGEVMQIGLALTAEQGSFHPGVSTTHVINSQYHKVTLAGASGSWQEGGSMFIYVLPTRGYFGPFSPGVWAIMAIGAGPGSILGDVPGSGRVGALITEDLGAAQ